MTRRIALYPGTFDPPTLGHHDIVRRAVKLVDHLIIGVATNAAKTPLFNLQDRVAIMQREVAGLTGEGLASIEVRAFQGLLMDFAGEVGAKMIVRGLRAVSDFEYEFQMVGMNAAMKAEVETVFLMADPQHQAIASRLVKEIALLGGDVSPFVSPHVAGLLKQRAKDLANGNLGSKK